MNQRNVRIGILQWPGRARRARHLRTILLVPGQDARHGGISHDDGTIADRFEIHRLRGRPADPEKVHRRRRRRLAAAHLVGYAARHAKPGADLRRPRCAARHLDALGAVQPAGGNAELKEGVPTKKELPDGSAQGINDFPKIGYGGPAPPPGKPHRYYFKVYALDARLDLNPGASKQQLLDAMKGHILGDGGLMGTYGRSGKLTIPVRAGSVERRSCPSCRSRFRLGRRSSTRSERFQWKSADWARPTCTSASSASAGPRSASRGRRRRPSPGCSATPSTPAST